MNTRTADGSSFPVCRYYLKGGDTLDWKERAERLRFDEGKSWTEVAKALKPFFPELTDQQRWEKVRVALRRTDRYKTKGKVTFENIKEPDENDIDNYYEQLKAINSATMKLEKKQTKASIQIDEDKPIGIAFWGLASWRKGR